MRNFFPVVLLASFIGGFLTAQTGGWERRFGNPDGSDLFYSILKSADGGYVAVGETKSGSDSTANILWTRVDEFGELLASKTFGTDSLDEVAESIIALPGGDFLVAGYQKKQDEIFAILARLEPDGDLVWWKKSPTPGSRIWAGTAASDGHFLFAGEKSEGGDRQFYLAKTDENGTFLFEKIWSDSLSNVLRCIRPTAGGGCVVGGQTQRGMAGYDGYLAKLNENGLVLWQKNLGTTNQEHGLGLTEAPQNGWLLAGWRTDGSTDEDPWFARTDENGNLLWQKNLMEDAIEQAWSVTTSADGNFAFTGETRPSDSSPRDLVFFETDTAGNLLLSKKFGGLAGDRGYSILPESDGGFVIGGHSGSCFSTSCVDAFLIRTDLNGNTFSGLLHGQLLLDADENCLPDNPPGPPLKGWMVGINGPDGTQFSLTDADGFYQFEVDTGAYEVWIVPQSAYWQSCQDTVPVVFSGSTDSVQLDFLAKKGTHCPLIQVDLATARLRRCFENTYSIRACNLGTEAAATPKIEILLDPWLTPTGSSLPYSTAGDTLVFDLPAMQPFDCQQFKLTVVVDCDSTLIGQSHCSTARALPFEICLPAPDWDSSHVEVHAVCQGDSLKMTIENTGIGPMSLETEYIITEDIVIFKQGNIQLGAGADTTIAVAFPAGKTMWLRADQTPGHPGISRPAIAVEGCGAFPFETGFVLQFPQDDGDPFADTDCRENVGSFDPNDKQGFPAGFDVSHFIEIGDDIEYLIRFQNTGTDTAFRVEVRDSLSPWLDPAAIQMGASSHPFRFEISGNGILRFIFDDILLPDSTTNEAGSHGFVKFRIAQKPGIPLGSVIENQAAIYFDFNAPVFTNTTFHTIGENFISTISVEPVGPDFSKRSTLKISPNPFLESTFLSWDGGSSDEFRVRLTDVLGHPLFEKTTAQPNFHFEKNGLPGGVYFIEIIENQRVIERGRLVK